MLQPPFCPYGDCPTQSQEPAFTWRHRGRYYRKCDGRWVKRFSCNVCERRFSTQTFKTDFRWRKPKLHFRVFDLFISKVTIRQIARIQKVRRPTIERRLIRIGEVCKLFHSRCLAQTRTRGGLFGEFVMDELETYETDRRLSPVTMPVLIQRHSFFVVHGETGTLPARGNLKVRHRIKKERRDILQGKRKSGSRSAVRNTLQRLKDVHSPRWGITLSTDLKHTYGREFRRIAGEQFKCHRTASSKTKRDRANLLFPINHTFAMMRDSISRLVRRTWAASKLRQRLDLHFWIWVTYRNYIRGITVSTSTTPAQAAGVQFKAWERVDLLRWRWPEIGLSWSTQRGQLQI
jgi:transposase-like protein